MSFTCVHLQQVMTPLWWRVIRGHTGRAVQSQNTVCSWVMHTRILSHFPYKHVRARGCQRSTCTVRLHGVSVSQSVTRLGANIQMWGERHFLLSERPCDDSSLRLSLRMPRFGHKRRPPHAYERFSPFCPVPLLHLEYIM